MTDQLKGFLITLAGVICVVPDALFARLIEAEPLAIAFWRNTLSGGLLVILLWALQGIGPFRAALRTGWRGIAYGALIGFCGVLFTLAINATSVANVVFIIATMPVFAALFSWVLMGEQPRARTYWTMLVAGLGLALVAYGSRSTETAHWTGDAMALGVVIAFALALTLARVERGTNLLPMAGLGYIAAGLVCALITAPLPAIVAQPGLTLLHGAFIFGSLTLLALGPRYITAPEVALLILLESILAPLLVWALLGEAVGPYTLAGGAIIIAALALSNAAALARTRQKG